MASESDRIPPRIRAVPVRQVEGCRAVVAAVQGGVDGNLAVTLKNADGPEAARFIFTLAEARVLVDRVSAMLEVCRGQSN